MEKTFEYEEIQKILAEADELLQQLDPEIIEFLKEEERIQLERQVENLEKLKMDVQDKIGSEAPETGPYSGGVHEAIRDIVKASKGLASYLS